MRFMVFRKYKTFHVACLFGKSHKKFLCLLSLVLLAAFCRASYNDVPTAVDGNAAGMAGASIMRSNLWSNFNNQAGLGSIESLAVGGLHARRFSMDHMGTNAIAMAIPTGTGTIGANYSYYGFSDYNESIIGLGYGINLGEHFSAGIQLDYLRTYIAENYGHRGALAVEGGLIANPIENLLIGFHVFNPSQTHVSPEYGEKVPTIFRAGIAYKFFETTMLAIETEKNINLRPDYKIGIEHYTFNSFYIRGGVSTHPVETFTPEYAFGFGFIFNNIIADIAFANHLQLGFTPHLSINYTFDKK